jgi:hypothetical protein
VTETRCSDLSRAAGESLAATATTAEHWLLVEVRGGWSRDVGSPEALPELAREAVSDWRGRTPGSRLLFLRRPSRTEGPTLAFVVHAPESGGSVRRLELNALEDLGRVDLSRDGHPSDWPLVLVCGHGSRDACCALRGTAVFGALAPTLPEEELWISSHHGGHRFSANVIVLPGAFQLGRVEPEEATRVVSAALEGRIALDHYRGRTCYEAPAQAAEHAVRVSTGLDDVSDLRLLDVSGATVRFADASGVEHVAEAEEVPGPSVPVSCGTDPEPQPAFVARLG